MCHYYAAVAPAVSHTIAAARWCRPAAVGRRFEPQTPPQLQWQVRTGAAVAGMAGGAAPPLLLFLLLLLQTVHPPLCRAAMHPVVWLCGHVCVCACVCGGGVLSGCVRACALGKADKYAGQSTARPA
jgi:hypothetical protein